MHVMLYKVEESSHEIILETLSDISHLRYSNSISLYLLRLDKDESGVFQG